MEDPKTIQQKLDEIKETTIQEAKDFYEEIGLTGNEHLHGLDSINKMTSEKDHSECLHWTRLSMNSNHGIIIS